MQLIFKILIIIGIIVTLLIGSVILFVSQNQIRVGFNEPTYEFDEAQKDILPILPTTKAGIPQFVELLRQANQTKDISICHTLPTPQQYYQVSDIMVRAPTQEQWSKYCEVLVNDDPLLCEKIPALTVQNNMGNYVERGTEPYLSNECKTVFEILD